MLHTIPRNMRRGLVLLLLLAFFTQATAGINKLSFTYDEPIYIGVGYSDWSTGDPFWHGHIGHPPLINLLTAWPLLLVSDRPDPRTFPQWGSSDVLGFSQALLVHFGNLDRAAMLTRLPVVWIALLLAALVYRWASELWCSHLAGIVALLLFIFDPTVLAHGRLNTTDMGLAAFGFLAAYMLARYLRTPDWKWRVGVGLTIGLPFSSKASGPYFVGITGVLLFIWTLMAWRSEKRWFLRVVWTGMLWVGLAFCVLWAAYLFECAPLQPGGWPIPAASHWKGLPYINDYMQSGQITYFQGKLYDQNHPWAYFFVGFLVKTPIPSLCFIVGAVSVLFWHSMRKNLHRLLPDLLILFIVPVGYFMVAVLSALQIGQRHLLPVYPFLFVLCGGLAQRQLWMGLSQRMRMLGLGTASALLVWLAVGTLSIYPYELSYFNELVGGADQGHHILSDSSVDWGQALKATKTYITTHQIAHPNLAAFSSLDPALYGLDFEPLPPTLAAPIVLSRRFNPAPGTYFISAVPLHGLWLLDPDTYSWFRQRKPDAMIGHAIFVYNVTAQDAEEGWIAQCALPMPVLSSEQLTAGFGRTDVREIAFECTQSWLYPADGDGWYILPGDDDDVLSAWMEKRLHTADLVYVQRAHWIHPAARIYRSLSRDWELSVNSLAALEVDGPLSLLGYELDAIRIEPGQSVELSVFWQVCDVPRRLLSLMAHLIGPDGADVAVGDGLGIPIEQWRPGDVIVQRHILAVPPDAHPGSYSILIGAYWLDTIERWSIREGDDIRDAVLLQNVLQLSD